MRDNLLLMMCLFYICSKPAKTETEKSIIAALNVISKGVLKHHLSIMFLIGFLFLFHPAREKSDHQTALNTAKNLLNRLSDMRKLPNKEIYRSDVHSVLGNIYMEMSNLPQATLYYRKGKI